MSRCARVYLKPGFRSQEAMILWPHASLPFDGRGVVCTLTPGDIPCCNQAACVISGSAPISPVNRARAPATSATGHALVAPSSAASVTRFVGVTRTLLLRLPRARPVHTPLLPNLLWSRLGADLISPCRAGYALPRLPAATSSCPQHPCSPLHCHALRSTRLTVHILA